MIPALSKTEKTKLAAIILGEISPSAILFIVLSRPRNTKELIALLGPFIPGDTLREKVSYAFTVTRPAFDSDARFREVAFGVLAKLRGVTDDEGEPVEVDGDAPASDITADKLKAVMATPMFVMRDNSVVRRQAAQLKAAGYNAVASLVDLQTGEGQRDYIVKGRSATKLSDAATANIQAVIAAGLTPVVIIRNDWAVRRKAGSVPSIGGQPDTPADFYSATRLRYEKDFLDSLAPLFDHIHIQLSIEPEHPESADFALQLARHLRAAGFSNRIFINPYASAIPAHESIRAALDASRVEWARSHHGDSVPIDPVWNTDGDTAVNGSNVRSRVRLMEASGKGWILWTQSLANCQGNIPAEYLDVGLADAAPATNLTGQERGFLWKPIGENSKKLRVLLPPQFTGKVDLKAVELWHGNTKIETLHAIGAGNPTAEGPREHFAGNKPGGAYNADTQVRANAEGSVWVWTIAKTGSRNENLKAAKISEAGENR